MSEFIQVRKKNLVGIGLTEIESTEDIKRLIAKINDYYYSRFSANVPFKVLRVWDSEGADTVVINRYIRAHYTFPPYVTEFKEYEFIYTPASDGRILIYDLNCTENMGFSTFDNLIEVRGQYDLLKKL